MTYFDFLIMHIFNAKIKICQKDSSSLNQDMHFKIQRHKMGFNCFVKLFESIDLVEYHLIIS